LLLYVIKKPRNFNADLKLHFIYQEY